MLSCDTHAHSGIYSNQALLLSVPWPYTSFDSERCKIHFTLYVELRHIQLTDHSLTQPTYIATWSLKKTQTALIPILAPPKSKSARPENLWRCLWLCLWPTWPPAFLKRSSLQMLVLLFIAWYSCQFGGSFISCTRNTDLCRYLHRFSKLREALFVVHRFQYHRGMRRLNKTTDGYWY